MKLGIMQPYFFPYIGYFSLLRNTDKWIVFDTVQYIERGWINRNKIIHPAKPEAMYVTVPLMEHRRIDAIRDIRIDRKQLYVDKILGQIQASYKKRSPYFDEVFHLVEGCLNTETESISRLNILSMKKVCGYLEISLDLQIFSEMKIDLGKIDAPDEWALNISKALGAEEYINPPGGKDFFCKEKYEKSGIKLSFLKANSVLYDQKKSVFLPNLSIIDAMMFNSKEDVRNMLDDFSIL